MAPPEKNRNDFLAARKRLVQWKEEDFKVRYDLEIYPAYFPKE